MQAACSRRKASRQLHTPRALNDRDTIDRIRRTRPRRKWFSHDHIDRSGVRHGSNAYRVALRVLSFDRPHLVEPIAQAYNHLAVRKMELFAASDARSGVLHVESK
jgi:hypothetical protein